MLSCRGCSLTFPNCAGTNSKLCNKCIKREDVVNASDAEQKAIEDLPQCLGCSAVYPFLIGHLCGVCKQNTNENSDRRNEADIIQGIRENAASYSSTASNHRLNQNSRKQNPALQSASIVKRGTSDAKKLAKTDGVINIEASLWVYPANGKAGVKSQILPEVKKFFPTQMAGDIFAWAKLALTNGYEQIPISKETKINHKDPSWGVQQNTVKNVTALNLNTINAHDTVSDLFNRFKHDITDSDNKARLLHLRMYVYEIPSYQLSSEDDDDFSQLRLRTTPKNKSRKRKRSPIGEYVSSFRGPVLKRPALSVSRDSLRYKFYSFRKVTFPVNEFGAATEHEAEDEELIEIAQDWQLSIGDTPKNGYIAKGLTKLAFKGRYNDKDYAIFQLKHQYTNYEIEIDLKAELRLLNLGQYFAESFQLRAKHYKVKLPVIRWNCDGAFVGDISILGREFPSNSTDNQPDNRSLLFQHFLAAPLLSVTGRFEEQKFCGANGLSKNTDKIGMIIDAFAHSVLVDSKGALLLTDLQGVIGPTPEQSICLFDPQGHSFNKSTGFWDEGADAMRKWQTEHACNKVCKSLGLDKAEVVIPDDELMVPEEELKPNRMALDHLITK